LQGERYVGRHFPEVTIGRMASSGEELLSNHREKFSHALRRTTNTPLIVALFLIG